MSFALGDDHPLTRSASAVREVQTQGVVVAFAIAFGVVATLRHVSLAPIVLGVSVLLEVALLIALCLARQLRTERAWDVIIDEGERLEVAEVRREWERLSTCKRRNELARSLERALDSAERWYAIGPWSRPPEGVRLLAGLAPEVRQVADRVRGQGTGVKGIALLARFLAGGSGSPLCAGDVHAMRCELLRVAYLLTPATQPPNTDRDSTP